MTDRVVNSHTKIRGIPDGAGAEDALSDYIKSPCSADKRKKIPYKMTDSLQADSVMRRQTGFVQCYRKKIDAALSYFIK